TVLPSEYGIDPSGIGNLLGLTDMGKIKVQLAEEAAAEEAARDENKKPAAPADNTGAQLQRIEAKLDQLQAALSKSPRPALTQTPQNIPVAPPSNTEKPLWKDELSIRLSPGQGIEIKLVMEKGATAWFEWTANGSRLNFDTHGEGGGRSVRYKKGRGVAEDTGTLTAPFSGNHGWFWRNRTKADVTLTLKTRGEYIKLKRTA
ncbi:MAG: hypothetical protein MI802_11425, partial [Desulfobacterales bacterium]|nr:hypothetical protein [Desulfobacterales bacterium]